MNDGEILEENMKEHTINQAYSECRITESLNWKRALRSLSPIHVLTPQLDHGTNTSNMHTLAQWHMDAAQGS